jgi:pyridoxamine 5'-phosphate oxidase
MNDLYAEALVTFRDLLDEARSAGDPEPTAMTVASVDGEGQPSARTVLLKGFDERGFVFYTNVESRKGEQIRQQPKVALLFLWKALRHQVQVKIEGSAVQVDDDEADRYFASRPRDSQIGAWASLQSQTLDSRATLEQRIDAYATEFDGRSVTRPPHWSGFRVAPSMIEFWYGVPARLHERQRYELGAEGWTQRLLYP